MRLPKDHPRYLSLKIRHKLTEGFRRGLVADGGLIAHGRGEAFDYLLGEKTTKWADRAEKAACALLLSAEHPVVSVNGNVVALVVKDAVKLAEFLGACLEVNLFYRTVEREKMAASELKKAGAKKVYGLRKKHNIPELGSLRANVDDALWNADVVLVALEDGDRTEALKHMGKKVVAVDLNPMSRTAQTADVSIVDNIVRAFPNMVGYAKKLRGKGRRSLEGFVNKFDNKRNLEEVLDYIRSGVR